MRLTIIFCQKRGCTNVVRTGFRFCRLKNCGKRSEEE